MGPGQIGSIKEAGKYVARTNASSTIGPPNNSASGRMGVELICLEQLGPGHLCRATF